MTESVARAPRSTIRVLVVDDDPAIVRTLAINLTGHLFVVRETRKPPGPSILALDDPKF